MKGLLKVGGKDKRSDPMTGHMIRRGKFSRLRIKIAITSTYVMGVLRKSRMEDHVVQGSLVKDGCMYAIFMTTPRAKSVWSRIW